MQDCDICFEKYNPKCALPYPCPTPKCNEIRNVCSLCSTNIDKCPFCRSIFSKKEDEHFLDPSEQRRMAFGFANPALQESGTHPQQKKDNHIPSPVFATPAVMPIGWDIPIPEGPYNMQNFQYTYPQSFRF